MTYTMEQYEESAQAIRARLKGFVPKVAMVLGSGLGFLGDQVENPIAIDYHHIPHFKASTAPGHKGRLVCGMLDGQAVAVMQGRMHHYEGYSYEEVSYAVRVLRLLGCDTLVVTNAAGCVRQDWHAGELMLITDQIKMFSPSPLRGENLPQFGPRFPDASHLYSPRLQQLAREAARDLGANSMTVFRRVILPLSLPGVISGITMVFVPSVSTFAISRMLGGGTELLLGDLIERQFLGGAYNPQLGAAISLVMMIIVLVCMLVMNRFGEGEEQAVML